MMTPPGNWSLFRGGSNKDKVPEVKPAKIHSFDALMNAPQGWPVSVRMQRDTAARQQTQPLFNFFKNALGLNTTKTQEGSSANPSAHQSARCLSLSTSLSFSVMVSSCASHAMHVLRHHRSNRCFRLTNYLHEASAANNAQHASCRSPRASHLDQSTGLDGRSDMSRDLSTTHALSRTLSFMSCGVSENLLSPTGGHSPHTSFFHPSASALEDQQLGRSGLSIIPRTRIAGLPLFLHGDIVAMPQASNCTPSSAVPRPGAPDYFGSGRKHGRMPVEAVTGLEQVCASSTLFWPSVYPLASVCENILVSTFEQPTSWCRCGSGSCVAVCS